MTSHRSAATAFSLIVVAALLSPSPASAAVVDGSVGELPFPDFGINEFLDEQFSGDLSTAVFTRDPAPIVGEPATNAGLTMVLNLQGGQQRVVQPARGATGQVAVQLDEDGSHLLMAARWEGVSAGDADGGEIDLFVVDTTTDEVVPITSGVPGENFVAIGMDRAGDTVLLRSGPINGPIQLHVWESGAVTAVPVAGILTVTAPLQLSGDGTKLLYTTAAGADLTWHVQDLSTGDEVTTAARTVFSASMSDDGGVVAGVEIESVPASASTRIWLASIWNTEGNAFDRYVIPSVGGLSRLNADGSTLFGSTGGSVASVDDDAAVWQLDTITGVSEYILQSSARLRGLIAVASNGDRLVVRAVPTAVGQLPVTARFIESRGTEELDRFFEIDLTEPPVTVPGYSGTLDDQLERLYQAFFNRPADAQGLAYWRVVRASGASLFDVSNQFIPSAEFIDTYGNLDNEAFIDLVYRNVLGRSPDAGGRVFWLDQLTSGRARGEVMALFSDSPEFIERTGTRPPENATAASVRRLYSGYFGREADASGIAFWIGQAETGVPLETISAAFLGSPEFSAIYETSELLEGLVNDADSLAIIGFGNTVGIVNEDEVSGLSVEVQDGTISLAQVMVVVTSNPEFVALTSTTPMDG